MEATNFHSVPSIGEATAAILARVTSDLAEWMDCHWTVAVSKVDGHPMPLCIGGSHPNLRAFLAHVSSGLSDHCGNRLNTQPWMPQLLFPIEIPDGGDVVIACGPKRNHEAYCRADRDLITTFLAQIANVLNNHKLARRVAMRMEALQRTQDELQSAREVQSRLLPSRRPPVEGVDYYGHCEPAGAVGGDFFDFVPLPDSALAISIGDVSGKGIPAAIVMSGLQATLRGLAGCSGNDVPALLQQVNRLVWEMSPDNFFASLLYARVEPRKNRLTFVNAGHEAALLLRGRTGRVERLESNGTVLGLRRDVVYHQTSIRVESGDTLVALTDGVTEAVDTEGRELREAGLLRAIQEHSEDTPVDLAHYIMEFVDSFTGGVSADDKTVVVARFTGLLESSLFRIHEAAYLAPLQTACVA